MGPLQLVSHVVQKHLVGEQETHWDKEITILEDVSSLFVLSQCVSCTTAKVFLYHVTD